jgi:NAD+ kinase
LKRKSKSKSTYFTAKVKAVVLVCRPESNNAVKNASELAAWLKKRGIKVFSHPQQHIGGGIKKIKTAQMNNIDLVIVLGGDGTYLHAVRLVGPNKIPILGINMGSLGFLTETRKDDLYDAVTMTLEGRMEMRPRAMLEVKVQRNGKLIHHDHALNDVVLERGPFSQLITIAIFSEHHLVGEIKADGVVVASPTGSTAYNLAAGGPILHPHVHSIVVTPICPHSLTHRPIIFPDDQALTFRLLIKNQRAYLHIDGQIGGDLRAGDEVIVTRSETDHYILRKSSQNYFDLLREKLRFGER